MAADRPRTVARPSRASSDGNAVHSDLSRVLDSIRAIVRTLRLSGRASEHTLGVNGAQLFVLQKLGEESAQSLAELASRTHTDPSSVSVVVSRLVERGLVSRETSTDDARRVTISLTATGRGVLRRAPRAAQTQLIEAATALPPRQLRALADGLAELVERMEPEDESERTATARTAPRARSARR